MAAPLISLVLDYYHHPLAFRHLSEGRRPLPDGFDKLLEEFCVALAPANIAETAERFAVKSSELEQAARFWIRHVLLNPEADYYRCLGLNRGATAESIRRHYQLLIRLFHPDRAEELARDFGDLYASRINLAYQVLSDPRSRQAYDSNLVEYEHPTTSLAWFFQAQQPLVRLSQSSKLPKKYWNINFHFGLRWVIYGLGAIAVSAGVLFLLARMQGRSVLEYHPPQMTDRSNGSTASSLEPVAHVSPFLASDSTLTQTASPAPLEIRGELFALMTGIPLPSTQTSPVVEPTLPDQTPQQAQKALSKPEEDINTAKDQALPPTALDQLGQNGSLSKPKPAIAPPPEKVEPLKSILAEKDSDLKLEKRAESPKSVSAPKLADTAKAQPSPPSKTSVKSDSPSNTKKNEETPNPQREAQDIIQNLQAAYRNRDAAAFAALFTPHAYVNEGRGRSLVHTKYADFFQRVRETRLSIDPIEWRKAPDGRLIGSGSFSVGAKYLGSNQWQKARGSIEFILVWDGRRYQIERMIYRLR